MIDSHVHIDRVPHYDAIYREIPCLIPGVNGEDHRSLTQKFPKALIATGVHPMFAKEFEQWDVLRKLLASGEFAAVGECGLDRRFGDLERQLEVFEKQILLAGEYDLPLIIHAVGHPEKLRELYKQYQFRGVIHFYSYKTVPPEFLEGDIYFGYCSRLAENSKTQKKFASTIPVDKILVETDADESSNADYPELKAAYQRLAQLKGMGLDELELIVQKNYKRLFSIN